MTKTDGVAHIYQYAAPSYESRLLLVPLIFLVPEKITKITAAAPGS